MLNKGTFAILRIAFLIIPCFVISQPAQATFGNDGPESAFAEMLDLDDYVVQVMDGVQITNSLAVAQVNLGQDMLGGAAAQNLSVGGLIQGGGNASGWIIQNQQAAIQSQQGVVAAVAGGVAGGGGVQDQQATLQSLQEVEATVTGIAAGGNADVVDEVGN